MVSTHKCYTHKAFENYDIILSNGSYQQKELELSENLFNFKKKKIVNTGYLYLENLSENKNKNKYFQKEQKFCLRYLGIKTVIIYLIGMRREF